MAPLLGWSRFSMEASGTSCSVEYYPNDGYESYIWTSAVFCYVLPMLVMIICAFRNFKISREKITISHIHVYL
jgi:hypothetical protein